ncbi:Exosome complex component Rrp42 [uncultured archaeon]|nr:Exosome complex component Rrp42 [uncultured archaeon]
MASPDFEPGPPNETGIELARLVDRGVRESKAIDLEALCITPGKQVWIIFIDVHILDDCGNILDAASIGAIAALLTTKVPASKFGLGEDYPLPVKDIPIATTAIEFGDVIMFDPDSDEESIANTKLTVLSTADGSICGMQKSGTGVLRQEQIYRIVDIACEKAKEIREKFLEE